jgi:hypothetical protein
MLQPAVFELLADIVGFTGARFAGVEVPEMRMLQAVAAALEVPVFLRVTRQASVPFAL